MGERAQFLWLYKRNSEPSLEVRARTDLAALHDKVQGILFIVGGGVSKRKETETTVDTCGLEEYS